MFSHPWPVNMADIKLDRRQRWVRQAVHGFDNPLVVSTTSPSYVPSTKHYVVAETHIPAGYPEREDAAGSCCRIGLWPA